MEGERGIERQGGTDRYKEILSCTAEYSRFLNTSASANFPPAIRQNVSLTQEKCLVLQPSANGRESCVIS